MLVRSASFMRRNRQRAPTDPKGSNKENGDEAAPKKESVTKKVRRLCPCALISCWRAPPRAHRPHSTHQATPAPSLSEPFRLSLITNVYARTHSRARAHTNTHAPASCVVVVSRMRRSSGRHHSVADRSS